MLFTCLVLYIHSPAWHQIDSQEQVEVNRQDSFVHMRQKHEYTGFWTTHIPVRQILDRDLETRGGFSHTNRAFTVEFATQHVPEAAITKARSKGGQESITEKTCGRPRVN